MTDTHSRTSTDLEPERQLLGAMLLRAEAIDTAIRLVTADDYYSPRHAQYHQTILALHQDGLPANPETVTNELDRGGLLDVYGGRRVVGAELLDLLSGARSSSTAWAHAEQIARTAANRHLAATLDQATQALRQGNTDLARQHAAEAALQPVSAAEGIPWEDVAAVVRGDVDDVVPELFVRTDGQALMYPGLTHWLAGDPGKGKTWVALHVTAEQLLAGRFAMYLDWEGNRRIVGSRLRALGVPADVVQDGLLYWRPDAITPAITSTVVATIEGLDVASVVIDGAANSISAMGLNEDKAADVIGWMRALAQPAAEAGAAVLILDHLVKDKAAAARGPRGSGAKTGQVSGSTWEFKEREAFNRQRAGLADLVQVKDREGYVGVDGEPVVTIHFRPDPATGRLHIVPDAPAQKLREPGAAPLRPTVLMERVSNLLETLNTTGIHPSVNQIIAQTNGKKQFVVEALRVLIAEGYVTAAPGPRNSQTHTSTLPYRQSADPQSDHYEPLPDAPEEAMF